MIIPANNVTQALTFADRYLDLEGLAVYSSLGKTTLRRHMRDSGLPYYKLDGKILVKQSEFDRWMQQRMVQDTHLDDIAAAAVKGLLSDG